MSSLCLSFCRLPSLSPLLTRTFKHTHSLTHTLPRLTYLWMEPGRVSHMWFRLATLSPHRGPKLTTSTLPWSSTCVYVPFSVCHCVSACKSACLYLCLVCLFLCARACVHGCTSQPEAEYSENSESRLVVQREQKKIEGAQEAL